MLEIIDEDEEIELIIQDIDIVRFNSIDDLVINNNSEQIFEGICCDAKEELSREELDLEVIYIYADWDNSRIQVTLFPPKTVSKNQ
ncbi:MAG: hypothetical protein K5648_00190 [Erysipelotrichaceae bacterium]|nr:hypothetical protein [Erysipelotrichaceae bacterium]